MKSVRLLLILALLLPLTAAATDFTGFWEATLSSGGPSGATTRKSLDLRPDDTFTEEQWVERNGIEIVRTSIEGKWSAVEAAELPDAVALIDLDYDLASIATTVTEAAAANTRDAYNDLMTEFFTGAQTARERLHGKPGYVTGLIVTEAAEASFTVVDGADYYQFFKTEAK